MKEKITLHSILLTLSVYVIYLWVNNPGLSYYNLQLSAFIILILIVSRSLIKPSSFRLVESVVSTMAVLLVVSDTGSLSSPLFFLNIFLLFELSLLLEPAIPLVLSACLILFYLFTSPPQGSLSSYTILLAFPFMTPLAIFLGKNYQKEENQKKQLQSLNKKVDLLKNISK